VIKLPARFLGREVEGHLFLREGLRYGLRGAAVEAQPSRPGRSGNVLS